MKCSDFLKELTDYLDNTMDSQTKAELEEHLQWCHNCYVVCNTTKSTIEIYRGLQTLRTSRRTSQPYPFRHHCKMPMPQERRGSASPTQMSPEVTQKENPSK